MAKTALEQWDETAANNTEAGTVDIDEGCAPSGMNNAMRELMAQTAKWIGDDTLVSATTTDLGSVPGRYVVITSTNAITGLGTIKAGTIKYIKFSGILTFTHNATSLILPGAANITTAAGDTAIMVSEGSGNWRCVNYQRAASSTSVVLGTAQASTSGTAIDFTGIPSWAKQITVSLSAVSFDGSGIPFIQIGDAGGVENTAYLGSGGDVVGAAATLATGAFAIGTTVVAGTVLNGSITLTLLDPATFTWAAFGVVSTSHAGQVYLVSGSKSLSAALDRVRVTINSGNFDAGKINIAYQ